MSTANVLLYTAFEGQSILATGALQEVALKVRKRLKTNPHAPVLLFSDDTGKQMDLDLRGSEAEILDRLKVYLPIDATGDTPAQPAGPGRPKLGVVAREVSLLPRHWEWLSTQAGGASGTIRRLVDEAKKGSSGKERVRAAQERTHKFMTALAGDLPHYEEALRALYAKDRRKFQNLIGAWPTDIRSYSKNLAMSVWE